MRPGTIASGGRWRRRHPRSVNLAAALLPGVLLYDRLGISHGTSQARRQRGIQARPSGPSLWNTAAEGVFRDSAPGIPAASGVATRQPSCRVARRGIRTTDWPSPIHGRHSTTLRMHVGTKRCCCQPGPPTRLEQNASWRIPASCGHGSDELLHLHAASTSTTTTGKRRLRRAEAHSVRIWEQIDFSNKRGLYPLLASYRPTKA
ncbi:hypothetical protein QBC39DRAFT_355100 [Podospora conica]|nr:hypothetical protein QBC39DRAFT_355100 [Schizothecium conicum]